MAANEHDRSMLRIAKLIYESGNITPLMILYEESSSRNLLNDFLNTNYGFDLHHEYQRYLNSETFEVDDLDQIEEEGEYIPDNCMRVTVAQIDDALAADSSLSDFYGDSYDEFSDSDTYDFLLDAGFIQEGQKFVIDKDDMIVDYDTEDQMDIESPITVETIQLISNEANQSTRNTDGNCGCTSPQYQYNNKTDSEEDGLSPEQGYLLRNSTKDIQQPQ